jgi:hypothetical protein
MTIEQDNDSGFLASKLKSCLKKPPDDDSDEDATSNSFGGNIEEEEENSDDGVEDPIYAMINAEIEQNAYNADEIAGVVGKHDQYDASIIRHSNSTSAVTSVLNTLDNTATNSRRSSTVTQVDEDGNAINKHDNIDELGSENSKKDLDDDNSSDRSDDDSDDEEKQQSKFAKYWDSIMNKSKALKEKLTYTPHDTAMWSYLRHFSGIKYYLFN